MGIVLVGSTKGGTGKSTLCCSLAAMRAKGGRKVLIIDTDAQTSALKWAGFRAEDEIEPQIVSVAKRKRVLEDVVAMGDLFDTVLVDAGGEDSREMRQCLGIADYILTPLKPNQFDVMSLSEMARLVQESRDATGQPITPNILWNQCSTHSRATDVHEANAMVEPFSEFFHVLEGYVKTRQAFIRSAASGLSVTELSGKDVSMEANQEMAYVYRSVFGEEFV